MNMTDILLALRGFCTSKNHDITIPNVHTYYGEYDFMSITSSGYIYEYEIKTSRSDFRRDFRQKVLKHEILSGKRMARGPTPKRFWFVVPENLIRTEEVPKYSGLIYIKKHPEYADFDAIEVVRAPTIKGAIKADQKFSLRIIKKFSWKYWSLMERHKDLQDMLSAERQRGESDGEVKGQEKTGEKESGVDPHE